MATWPEQHLQDNVVAYCFGANVAGAGKFLAGPIADDRDTDWIGAS